MADDKKTKTIVIENFEKPKSNRFTGKSGPSKCLLCVLPSKEYARNIQNFKESFTNALNEAVNSGMLFSSEAENFKNIAAQTIRKMEQRMPRYSVEYNSKTQLPKPLEKGVDEFNKMGPNKGFPFFEMNNHLWNQLLRSANVKPVEVVPQQTRINRDRIKP